MAKYLTDTIISTLKNNCGRYEKIPIKSFTLANDTYTVTPSESIKNYLFVELKINSPDIYGLLRLPIVSGMNNTSSDSISYTHHDQNINNAYSLELWVTTVTATYYANNGLIGLKKPMGVYLYSNKNGSSATSSISSTTFSTDRGAYTLAQGQVTLWGFTK